MTKFIKAMLLLVLFFTGISVFSQDGNPERAKEKHIKSFIAYYEFSSIVKWDNKVLLFPQRPGEKKINGSYVKDTNIKAAFKVSACNKILFCKIAEHLYKIVSTQE